MQQPTFEVSEVHKITDTERPGVYLLDISLSINGDIQRCSYISAPDDPHGANPAIRIWMNQNPDAQVHPYVPPPPPTPEEIREKMPKLSARQFRIGLVRGGFTLAQVTGAIEAMPEGAAKEEAKIEWEYATEFKRTHPLIASVAAALGLDDDEIDALWNAAINL